jgi:K+ transporter
MMVLTIALAVSFGNSDRLAGAYGTAVSTTMLLTTALLYNVMRARRGWPVGAALTASGLFLAVDFAFFDANLFKIRQGGWIPLTFGTFVFFVMVSWHYCFQAVRQPHTVLTETPHEFFRHLKESGVPRVPGTAIFLTRVVNTIPFLIIEHVAQMIRFWTGIGAVRRHLPTDVRGVERVDDRRVISGIVHVLKSGCRWCDSLDYFVLLDGSPQSLWRSREEAAP